MWGKNKKTKSKDDLSRNPKPYAEEIGDLDLGKDHVYEPLGDKQKTWDEEMGNPYFRMPDFNDLNGQSLNQPKQEAHRKQMDFEEKYQEDYREIQKEDYEEAYEDTLEVYEQTKVREDKPIAPASEERKKKHSVASIFTAKANKAVKTNKYMIITVIPILIVFAVMITYIVRFMMYDSQAVISSPYNKRTSKIQEKVRRGKIISANDKVLAETINVDGTDVRSYPYENMFAQVVGYSRHGKGGLEAEFNYNLLVSHTDVMSQIKQGLTSSKLDGDSVYTTLDTRLQKAAYEAMGDYRGAVVAIEPSTGKVRAMVSKPDFDPNYLDENWEEITQDSESGRLMNRCIQGLYPPGSTYKTLTVLEYLEEHPYDYGNFTYNCEGSTIINSVKIKCYHDQEHGEEDLNRAFAKSCNTAFVTLGCSLNRNKFIKLNEDCLFNQPIDFTLAIKQSRFPLTKDSPDSELPQTVIGQGNTLVTPMHMALIMCAVANDGILMEPTLLDRIESVEGSVVEKNKISEYKKLMTPEKAKVLQGMLRNVVTDGTGSALNTDEYIAAGKTGTAENEKEGAHSWFVGYAGAKQNQPDLVVCVIVENQGAGSEYAAPIARDIFDSYYANELNTVYGKE